MSDALPTEWVVGEDTYAVRTFKAEDGQLTSVNQGGGHWADGMCIATRPRDTEHVAPVPGCRCGVYAWWTVEQLLDQYAECARYMVAVDPHGQTMHRGPQRGEGRVGTDRGVVVSPRTPPPS